MSGREATTSVYRFAHHDNDYVIAIVAATQRPKRKDEGRSLNSERLKGRDIDKQAQRPDTLHCCPRGEGYQWLTSMGALLDNAWDRIPGDPRGIRSEASGSLRFSAPEAFWVFVGNREQRKSEGLKRHLKVLKGRITHNRSSRSGPAQLDFNWVWIEQFSSRCDQDFSGFLRTRIRSVQKFSAKPRWKNCFPLVWR